MPVTSPSKTAYADALLARDDLHPSARILIEPVRAKWRLDTREDFTRPEVAEFLRIGPTRGRELEQGPLPAYLIGRQRLIPADLVYIYKINQILASFPSDGPPAKARGGPAFMQRAKKAAPASGLEPVAHPRRPTLIAQPEPAPLKRGRGRPRKEPVAALEAGV